MQRILMDLVVQQNANTISTVGNRLAKARTIPAGALTELTAEGASNLVALQRILLHLAQREADIVLNGVKERATNVALAESLTELVRGSSSVIIEMQQHFLTMAAKQADAWAESARTGKKFAGKELSELAREGVENFVRSQKKLLDVVAQETANATGGSGHKTEKPGPKTEVTELARQGAEAFIDAQKKLLDVAVQEMEVNMKAARQAMEGINPLPAIALEDIEHRFLAAQKTLLDIVSRSNRAVNAEATRQAPARTARRRPASRRPASKSAAA
jgi:hypothetical protein